MQEEKQEIAKQYLLEDRGRFCHLKTNQNHTSYMG